MSIQGRYNRLDLGELIELARMLSVDISNDKNKGMFNIKKVRRTVRQYLEENNWPEKQLKRLFKRTPK
jgi:post-segregation antitoxin (ccd killing protein)